VDLHANAVLTVRQRQRVCDLVAAGVTITAAALVGCSRQTASKWVNRRRRSESLGDRSSRPHRSPSRTPDLVELAILRARAELREGPHVIGWALGIAASTVHAVLRRHGRSRLRTRPQREEIVRYERSRPGELVHVDIKKLGRIVRPGHRVTGDRSRRAKGTAGWQYLYVAIDYHSRLGFASVYPDETSESARSPSSPNSFASTGSTASRWSACSRTTAPASSAAGPMPAAPTASPSKRLGPTARRPTAKAERFIHTLLERWAYAYPYEHESERLVALAPALDFYNRFRPHRALRGLAPLQRVNNLPGTYS
jgi:transposase-like protein